MKKGLKYIFILAGIALAFVAQGCGQKHYPGFQIPAATPTIKVIQNHQHVEQPATATPSPVPTRSDGQGSGFTDIGDLFPGASGEHAEPTNVPEKTATPKPEKTKSPTKTPAPTKAPTPTERPQRPTNTPRPEKTPKPGPTPTNYPDATPTPGTFIVIYLTGTPTVAPTARPTATPRPTATSTPVPDLMPTQPPTSTPTPTLTPTNTPTPTPMAVNEAKKGDVVVFGHYEQDNDTSNGKEPIEWIVGGEKDGALLLVSRYGLDAKEYDLVNDPMTGQPSGKGMWTTCTLKSWLNGAFMGAAFDAEEKAQIKTTVITGGNNRTSTDKVFLLTEEECAEYLDYSLPDNVDCCRLYLTKYAIKQSYDLMVAEYDRLGMDKSNLFLDLEHDQISTWWIRSYRDGTYADAMSPNGFLFDTGMNSTLWAAIRPAIWVKKEVVQAP